MVKDKIIIIAPLHYFYFSNYTNPFPQNIFLEGEYKLKKFNNKNKVLKKVFLFLKDNIDEPGKKELKNCSYCITYKIKGSSIKQIEKIKNKTIEDIYRITRTLRIVKPTRTIPSIFCFENGKVKETRIKQREIIYLSKKSSPKSQYFIKKDAHKIRLYWKKAKFLYDNHENTYNRILNAIIFFETSFWNRIYKPRLISFVTCLESLFNTSSSQISYSLKIRCSLFLTKNKKVRRKIYSNLKKIYKLRSLFVHGQKTPSKTLKNINRTEEIMYEAENISRKCIQEIFQRNLLSVFSSTKKLEREFEKLELDEKSVLI